MKVSNPKTNKWELHRNNHQGGWRLHGDSALTTLLRALLSTLVRNRAGKMAGFMGRGLLQKPGVTQATRAM